MKVVEKYLSLYREKESADILLKESYAHVLVIPAYKEGAAFIKNLTELNIHLEATTLAIIVVNNPLYASLAIWQKNYSLVLSLKSLGHITEELNGFSLVKMTNLHLLVLGPIGIDPKMGVGLARKIGADLALSLIAKKTVHYPIIYTTDADAMLPKGYFNTANNAYRDQEEAAAFIYPFSHKSPKHLKQRLSIELYERRLYQYVEGLSFAGSIYAFHTIGSIIAINAIAYAKVRGYPKIAAGEDFYLLNKLRKVGSIVNLSSDPIKLSARVSDRVPFGTGPSLKQIMQFDDVLDAPIFYHPEVFIYLRWILQNIVFDFDIEKLMGIKHEKRIDIKLTCQAFLSLRGIADLKNHLAKKKQISNKCKAFHDWFDAFKTLKFIHLLRDAGLAMQSYRASLLP
jgi:hypothetical protein